MEGLRSRYYPKNLQRRLIETDVEADVRALERKDRTEQRMPQNAREMIAATFHHDASPANALQQLLIEHGEDHVEDTMFAILHDLDSAFEDMLVEHDAEGKTVGITREAEALYSTVMSAKRWSDLNPKNKAAVENLLIQVRKKILPLLHALAAAAKEGQEKNGRSLNLDGFTSPKKILDLLRVGHPTTIDPEFAGSTALEKRPMAVRTAYDFLLTSIETTNPIIEEEIWTEGYDTYESCALGTLIEKNGILHYEDGTPVLGASERCSNWTARGHTLLIEKGNQYIAIDLSTNERRTVRSGPAEKMTIVNDVCYFRVSGIWHNENNEPIDISDLDYGNRYIHGGPALLPVVRHPHDSETTSFVISKTTPESKQRYYSNIQGVALRTNSPNDSLVSAQVSEDGKAVIQMRYAREDGLITITGQDIESGQHTLFRQIKTDEQFAYHKPFPFIDAPDHTSIVMEEQGILKRYTAIGNLFADEAA